MIAKCGKVDAYSSLISLLISRSRSTTSCWDWASSVMTELRAAFAEVVAKIQALPGPPCR